MTDVAREIITAEMLTERIAELGAVLAEDYRDRNPLLVAVMTGAMWFLADLVRAIDIDLDVDFQSRRGAGACDGGIFPHLVAPGCTVDSTVPTDDHATFGYCGTSMASPQVAGAVALFIEYYRGLADYATDPSPALIKAALLPSQANAV